MQLTQNSSLSDSNYVLILPESSSVISADGAPTVISSITTEDQNNNGKIDRFKLTFSESILDNNLNGTTAGPISLDVIGYNGDSIDYGTPNDNFLYINITEGVDIDSSASPSIIFNTNGAIDNVGVPLFSSNIISTDLISPKIISAYACDLPNGSPCDLNLGLSDNGVNLEDQLYIYPFVIFK